MISNPFVKPIQCLDKGISGCKHEDNLFKCECMYSAPIIPIDWTLPGNYHVNKRNKPQWKTIQLWADQ